MRIMTVGVTALLLSGCVTGEQVAFKATTNQQALIRDGRPAIVSRQKNSVVMASPAARENVPGQRPVFVVGISNLTKAPLEFRVSNVSVTQSVNGGSTDIAVIPYERLVQEEKTRQAMAALGAGLAAAGNSISASQAGYYNSRSTVYTPRGTYAVNTTGYSPTAAAIAQQNASMQNEAMIGNVIETGRANMARLEGEVIKDNTLLPGEWYGGKLFISPLADAGDPTKEYVIRVMVGPDEHVIAVSQSPKA